MNVDYSQLSSLERHERIDNNIPQGNSTIDQVTYSQGIDHFIKLLNTNEIISEAFNNFLKNRDRDIKDINNERTLLFTGLDKLEKKLFFIIKNSLDEAFSIYTYNMDENKLTLTSEELVSENLTTYNHMFYEANKLKSKEEIQWTLEVNTIEKIWKQAKINLNFWNNKYIPDNNFGTYNLALKNIIYTKDDQYQVFKKTYASILSEENPDPINKFYSGNYIMISDFNTSHTTLLPDDILSFTRIQIKNARFSIDEEKKIAI